MTIDRQTGKIYVYELVPVGEPDEETGEYSEFEERDVTPDDVSRIAAQNAKGVISSLVREAGRQSIYDEFRGRVGDLVTGTVLQGTPDFTIIKIREGVEAELPHYDAKRNPGERNERPANEHYRHNQRLKVLIIEVRNPNADAPRARGEQARPAIVVSRTHPDLIRRLFEIEVPEIYEGVVEIKSVAREPGARSKVAVFSREANLDPVGACVGPKGSRVRMVVEELRNERVDVIQWSPDPAVYVANALSPAKVSHVEHRRGQQLCHGHRARRPAVAGHRQGGAERALGRPPHRLAHRYQAPELPGRVFGRCRDGRRGGGGRRLLHLRRRGWQPLPQPRPTEQPVLRRPCRCRGRGLRGRA